MIPILPEAAWREFRGTAASQGANLTTHQALIVDHQGREHRCYVKAAPPGNLMPLTEGIGWMLSAALESPRPEFAAVVLLPLPKLGQHMKLDQHWLRYPNTLAFCCSAVPGKHLQARWKWWARLRTARAFQHPDLARIAAFDMWVENRDRHTGNFLRTKEGEYVPIDNEFILYSLVWAATLTVAPHSLKDEARAVLKSAGYTKFEVSMVLASKLHEGALQKATPALQQFVHALFSGNPAQGMAVAAAILQFLGQRGQPDWLANELGYIV